MSNRQTFHIGLRGACTRKHIQTLFLGMIRSHCMISSSCPQQCWLKPVSTKLHVSIFLVTLMPPTKDVVNYLDALTVNELRQRRNASRAVETAVVGPSMPSPSSPTDMPSPTSSTEPHVDRATTRALPIVLPAPAGNEGSQSTSAGPSPGVDEGVAIKKQRLVVLQSTQMSQQITCATQEAMELSTQRRVARHSQALAQFANCRYCAQGYRPLSIT